uniref:Pentacotripeptide-repeat region of PRORP domain-containing protein n=1 Tax=Chromera velia CCMP2878 TaxID=1169474 RepID=A0A0G4G8F0_9ALVE|eukprot:Cvel_4340.t1-p1 / transcript=Cvel_4340.t1 / gene=Cvel_4340 / organism=Chromera_velia_CCMP2878 / gene_product=Pentatricopeptide repeat-containing protein, putative / transcript_product=Pentatricopeptide repeat-containing protein, putative / location=Cvel_scaffold188:43120-45023(+) / protein_length=288 / sequence_SO=supercontig / SO=protein_coding / is_pseudo=false
MGVTARVFAFTRTLPRRSPGLLGKRCLAEARVISLEVLQTPKRKRRDGLFSSQWECDCDDFDSLKRSLVEFHTDRLEKAVLEGDCERGYSSFRLMTDWGVCADRELCEGLMVALERAPLHRPFYVKTGKCCQWERALEVFERMKKFRIEPKRSTYNALFSVLKTAAGGSRWQRALDLYERNLKKGMFPDWGTWLQVVGLHAGGSEPQREAALGLLAEMKERGVEPDLKTYTMLLEVWKGEGAPNGRPWWCEAVNVLGEMKERGVGPDLSVYNAVLETLKGAPGDGQSW